MSERTDHLGDPLPDGFEAWACPVCTAVCNFEAMTMCASPGLLACGFERDQPESNGGAFGFIIRTEPAHDR